MTGDGPLGNADVHVGGTGRKPRQRTPRDRELQPDVRRIAEPQLEARAQAEHRARRGRARPSNVCGETCGEGERACGRPPCFRRQERADGNVRLPRHPDASQGGIRAVRDALDDSSPAPTRARFSFPRWSTATGTSGTTWIRSVCGNARSKRMETTVGRDSARRSSAAPSSASKFVPMSGARTRLTCRWTSGRDRP